MIALRPSAKPACSVYFTSSKLALCPVWSAAAAAAASYIISTSRACYCPCSCCARASALLGPCLGFAGIMRWFFPIESDLLFPKWDLFILNRKLWISRFRCSRGRFCLSAFHILLRMSDIRKLDFCNRVNEFITRTQKVVVVHIIYRSYALYETDELILNMLEAFI